MPRVEHVRVTSSSIGAIVVIAAAIAASGCSMAPKLEIPVVPTAQGYKEKAPWTPAAPADSLPRDSWWTLYGDTDLNALQVKLVANSPDLAAALARYNQAKAFSDQLRSGFFPTITASGSAERNRQSETQPPAGAATPRYFNAYALGVETDYELDLWGRIRNSVAAGRLTAEAVGADLESARLSLQAELADSYVTLRGLDNQAALLDETVQAYDRALALTKQRHDAGIVSGLDVARASNQLDSARSLLSQNLASRATTEHAIAALVGESPSEFSIAPHVVELSLPAVPGDLPSDLLQRRPDIAAAQRRTASANASVGVARAAYFPSIGLSATYGFRSTNSSDWLSAPNAAWSIGPSLLFDLFDSGRRKAEVAAARAALDEAGAEYRGVVLNAFVQVEDNLALLNHYAQASESERAAVTSAQQALDFSMNRYKEGAVSYLEVVQSQTTMLTSKQQALDLETRQLRASVGLIRALGGGWSQDR
jgi:NodT family efflux transporter outer membrane factor (OMF) lipoprotein